MPQRSIDLNRRFQALADPSRRAMIERLARGPASVSQLAAPLEMSMPAVMQHLQLLEGTGLVSTRKHGRVRTCRIETAPLRTLETWIAEQRTGWERRLDRLEAVMADQDHDSEDPR